MTSCMEHREQVSDKCPMGLHRKASRFIPVKLNFYRIHLFYFVFVILLASVILWGSNINHNSNDAEATFRLRYIDALYLASSAMTSSGMSPVNLGSLTGFQQALIFALIPMGNVMVISGSTVLVRMYWFRKKLKNFVVSSKAAQAVLEDIERQEGDVANGHVRGGDGTLHNTLGTSATTDHLTSTESILRHRKPQSKETRHAHFEGYGGFSAPWTHPRVTRLMDSPFRFLHRRNHHQPHSYLSFRPELDDRGRFYSLTEKQRLELGGVEYRALRLLAYLVPCYFMFWICLGIVILVPYSYYHSMAAIIRTSQPGNLEPAWWAIFNTLSSLTNCGMDLINANLVPFQQYYLVLIVSGTLILAGNQFFPIFLRLAIWALYRLMPRNSSVRHTCAFLLHHPRRCFILLFPSQPTWYLLAAQISIQFILWAGFGILNIGLSPISSLPAGRETMLALFQSCAVRVGGFSVVVIDTVAPALQILYLVAMYISAFPIILSLRQTNIYEERSLGIGTAAEPTPHRSRRSYLGMHLRRQLAYDLWWLVLAVFLVSIIERAQLVNDASDSKYFNIWSVVFETVSAYGTVGLSLGVPFDDYSFSGQWHTLSKLILIAVMLRGRHRGLPLAIDRAVLLPGQKLMQEMDRELNGRGAAYLDAEKLARRREQIRREESPDSAHQRVHQVDDDDDEEEDADGENDGQSHDAESKSAEVRSQTAVDR